MGDSVSVFSAHAADYDAQRRRLVPCFDLFYGTAARLLGLGGGAVRRVLDLGAGTGLLSEAVLARHPDVELVLLDGAGEMLERARKRLPAGSTTTVVGDLLAPLPRGPFDAVVSALAIHHLEDSDKRALFGRVHDVLVPGGVFVNAEQVLAPTPWLQAREREMWREACRAAAASDVEIADAERRMEHDRCSEVRTQLEWMGAAGLHDCGCLFKHLNFAVLAGWRSSGGEPTSRDVAQNPKNLYSSENCDSAGVWDDQSDRVDPA
jgi:tRNA (cmo5U34)-methyltransferase